VISHFDGMGYGAAFELTKGGNLLNPSKVSVTPFALLISISFGPFMVIFFMTTFFCRLQFFSFPHKIGDFFFSVSLASERRYS